ncbi:MAG: hypothetical protein Q9197_001244 [Variospora fuerteventurae]
MTTNRRKFCYGGKEMLLGGSRDGRRKGPYLTRTPSNGASNVFHQANLWLTFADGHPGTVNWVYQANLWLSSQIAKVCSSKSGPPNWFHQANLWTHVCRWSESAAPKRPGNSRSFLVQVYSSKIGSNKPIQDDEVLERELEDLNAGQSHRARLLDKGTLEKGLEDLNAGQSHRARPQDDGILEKGLEDLNAGQSHRADLLSQSLPVYVPPPPNSLPPIDALDEERRFALEVRGKGHTCRSKTVSA